MNDKMNNVRKKTEIQKMMEFLDKSLTNYHAIEQMSLQLEEEKFTKLSEKQVWQLARRKSYYMTRNDSSLMAFRIPDCAVDEIKGFHIYAAHSDSPAFKVKEHPEMEKEGCYVSVNTE